MPRFPAGISTALRPPRRRCWADFLGRIEIQTADPATRETFYTALYHSAMAPTLFNDVDGGYRGLDHKVHPGEGFQNYCTFSIWDVFRAEVPLLTIIQPQRIDDFVNGMLAHYRQFNQHALPVWPLAGNETWCMIGNHAIPIIVEAYAKGFRGFDAEAAYQAMRDTVDAGPQSSGRVPQAGLRAFGSANQSVSRTLEYAYDDWCLARMAQMLGKTDDAKLFAKRGQNYRNVFDSGRSGFVRGKRADGTWRPPFDPRELVWDDFTEATSWNYTWFVPHDVPGLIGLIGGDAGLDRQARQDVQRRLDAAGRRARHDRPDRPVRPRQRALPPRRLSLQLRRGAVEDAGADPPGHDRALQQQGRRHLRQRRLRPDVGLVRAQRAWAFIRSIRPRGVYVLGSPLVDRATIHLDTKYQQGPRLHHDGREQFAARTSISSRPRSTASRLERSWFTHAELVAGGELVLKMGPQPNKAWGQKAEDRPPEIAP